MVRVFLSCFWLETIVSTWHLVLLVDGFGHPSLSNFVLPIGKMIDTHAVIQGTKGVVIRVFYNDFRLVLALGTLLVK